MNTIIRLFLSLAPCALLFSCVKEDAILQQPEVREVKTYSLAVSAVKGERPDTKALKFDGQALKSVWAEGESVRVLKGNEFLGTLYATTAGDETTLSGTISGTLSVDDALTLEYAGPYYTYQKGTLDYIATHCDYATATVSVTSIEGGKVTTDAAHFKNQQAIVKFCLLDKDHPEQPLTARSLGVTVGGKAITVTPETPASELFVAVPAISGKPVSLMASVGDKVYSLNKESITLEVGKYYVINAKL